MAPQNMDDDDKIVTIVLMQKTYDDEKGWTFEIKGMAMKNPPVLGFKYVDGAAAWLIDFLSNHLDAWSVYKVDCDNEIAKQVLIHKLNLYFK